jgi:hypothetical protein
VEADRLVEVIALELDRAEPEEALGNGRMADP